MIFTIALRELKNLFLSPLAWAILAVTQGILAFQFLSYERKCQGQFSPSQGRGEFFWAGDI